MSSGQRLYLRLEICKLYAKSLLMVSPLSRATVDLRRSLHDSKEAYVLAPHRLRAAEHASVLAVKRLVGRKILGRGRGRADSGHEGASRGSDAHAASQAAFGDGRTFPLHSYLHKLKPHASKRGTPCLHSREVRSRLHRLGARARRKERSRAEAAAPAGCYCAEIRYRVEVEKGDDLRTSLCHCGNCESKSEGEGEDPASFSSKLIPYIRATEFTGGPYGITTKVPLASFHLTRGTPKHHTADNGSGSLLYRQFCATCGSPIAEWGAAAQDSARYIFYGTFDKVGEHKALDPKGEFFTSRRVDWLVPVRDTFQKREIKE